MGVLTVGEVILVNFPFADLKTYKKRPAVVVATGSLGTVILCQITSRELPNVPGAKLEAAAFASGSLPLVSYIRPDKLFTVDAALVHRKLGTLRPAVLKEVRRQIGVLFS